MLAAMAQGRDRSFFYVVGFGVLVVGLTLLQNLLSSSSGPASGKLAPDFTAQTLSGGEVRLSALRGKVVLVDFWARWCEPCVAMMPALQRLHERLAGKPFALLSVNIESGSPQRIASWMKQRGLTFTGALDPGGLAQRAYGVSTIPRVLLVDAAGVLRKSYGAGTSEDALAGDIEALLPGG